MRAQMEGMSERIPKPGEFYRHFKNKLYQIVAVAEHTETGELLVVYQALYGDYRVYARPASMFAGEVDHEKYPDVKQRFRFEQVSFDKAQNGFSADRSDWKDGAEPELRVNPWLERFLDAEGYEKQLEALNQMRGKVGQRELESICLVLDIPRMAGDPDHQIRQIVKHLEMRKKYDGSRLR